jgi:sortase (surface protein transpeptidase)
LWRHPAQAYAASLVRNYRVDQKLILAEAGQPSAARQANAQYINPTTDERLTLVTCCPPTCNTHRLIIVARPVS